MKLCDLDNTQYGLLFDVRRSIRYHDRRRAFFEQLHRVTSMLTILLAGSVFFELAGTGTLALWLRCVSAAAALLATLDMVVGYSARANLHAGLRARFADLEMAIFSGGLDPETWDTHQQQRLRIEQDEPPIYRALDLLCHNAICRAEGIAPDAVVSPFQRMTSQLFYWNDIAAEKEPA